MKISVIITTYNGSRWIAAALDSVLAQTLAPAEIIVINDGSTDDTAHVIARYAPRVQCIDQPNAGISAARNRGILCATGDALAFFDDDDIWLPQKLARQAALLDAHAEVGVVFCNHQNFEHETGTILLESDNVKQQQLASRPAAIPEAYVLQPQSQFAGTLDDNYALPSTLMVRADVLRQVGLFDTSLSYGEDWQMLLRLALVTQIGYCSDILLRRRIRTNSLSSHGKDDRDLLRALETLPNFAPLPASSRAEWEDMCAALGVSAAYYSRKSGDRAAARKYLATALKRGRLIGGRRYDWRSVMNGLREVVSLSLGRS
ncbi:MAG: glycosyltransferase family 2 protein [Burkholderiaceae bacterium]|nr:MAG: glycosyltransferase family 2 protein [Burkholderiaceae bacterium]